MINTEKELMLDIMDRYRNDEAYRRMVNSTELSNLSKLEQTALANMEVTDDGIEILSSDLSNHYDDFNVVDLETEESIAFTCANMAVAELLHNAFKENNIDKWPEFDLRSIKARMKGDLIATMDKPTVIAFIKYYNRHFPKYLPDKAKDFRKMLRGHINNGFGTGTFRSLAMTYNTNIYLDEITAPEQEEKKGFFHRKKR